MTRREVWRWVEYPLGVNPGAAEWVPFKWWNPSHWFAMKRPTDD